MFDSQTCLEPTPKSRHPSTQGTSLGGARPKATFTDENDASWLAKFPAHQDHRDVGAWKYLAWQLAREADIENEVRKTVDHWQEIAGTLKFPHLAQNQLDAIIDTTRD